MIPGTVHISPGTSLTAEENPEVNGYVFNNTQVCSRNDVFVVQAIRSTNSVW